MALTRITKGVIKPNENYDTHNINSTGIVTAIGLDVNGNGDISGNLSVGGVLTYEDVTSIDSVGIITAQSDIHVGGGVSAVGVGTFGSLDIGGDIDVDGHTNLDNISIAGVTTIADDKQLHFGDDADLKLYYQTSGVPGAYVQTGGASGNLTIKNQDAGQYVYIHGDNVHLRSTTNNEEFLRATYNGSVSLNYDNVKRFETTNQGINVIGHSELDNVNIAGVTTAVTVDVNGDLDVDGHTNLDNISIAGVTTVANDTYLTFGANANANSTLRVRHNSSSTRNEYRSTFQDFFASDLRIRNISTNNHYAYFWSNQISLFANGSEKLQIVGGGVNILNGNLSVSRDLDVDRHTNLDNVSIAGVTTFSDDVKYTVSNGSGILLDKSASQFNVNSGTIIRFQNNNEVNTDDGKIGTALFASGLNIVGSQTGGGLGRQIRLFGDLLTDNIKPTVDSSHSIGTSSNRFLHAYLDNLDVDGHTNLDNVSIAGVSTFTGNVIVDSGTVRCNDGFSSDVDLILNADANNNGAGSIIFKESGSEKLRIESDGQVGIGTNNPQQLLDLYDIQAGASGTAPVLLIRNGYAGTPNSSNALKSELRFAHRNHNSVHDFMATRIIADTSDNYNQRTHLRFYVAKGNNGTERLTISPDGYIGINDSVPQYPLDIQHDGGNQNQTPIIRLFQSTDGCHNAITLESSTSADKNIGIQFKNRSAVRGGIGYIQNDKINIYSGTSPAASHGMTINASGFCGINELSPDRILHVMGDSETWPAGFESSGSTAKISFKSSGTTNMYEVGVGAEGRSLIFLTTNTIRADITNDGVMRAKTLSGSYYPIASVRDGSSSARAAQSAWEIKKTLGPAAKTGYYYLINPYDSTVSQWWCDMDTDGGGWILIAHHGEGQMADQGTGGSHWWHRNDKGGFDTVGSGYKRGGGYWRKTNGDWGENTCGELMWDVRIHNVYGTNPSYGDYGETAESNHKVAFRWGTDQPLPTGNSNYTNIPNAGNRRFNEWCREVANAPGFNPGNYHQNVRSNIISGGNYFTEHMAITWCFRGTGGAADAGDSGPYWFIGQHANGLHQHYEENISGDLYGDGAVQLVSNQDTSWHSNPGGTNQGYLRLSKISDTGFVNIWLR